MLQILKVDSFSSFVVNSQAGLSGTTTVAKYPCILSEKRFFVWLGSINIAVFDKSTFMILADLAEKEGAKDLYLILERLHPQKENFLKLFRVIDAERVSTAKAQDLIKKDLLARALDVEFYKICL
jgi:hypothetical protein